MLMWSRLMALGVLALAGPALAAEPADLAAPVQILAGGKPIDVDVGHAAPFVADWNGDGVLHLLVGQFGEGKLRIYRNVGTKDSPRFAGFAWFQDGAEGGRVPSG
jgi:hypothetical protein